MMAQLEAGLELAWLGEKVGWCWEMSGSVHVKAPMLAAHHMYHRFFFLSFLLKGGCRTRSIHTAEGWTG